MIKTKRSETNKIESYTAKRNEALNESEKFLASDIKSFVDYFRNNSQACKDAINDAEEQKNIKIKHATILQNKRDECQKLATSKNKNIEVLEELYKYKKFLDKVSHKTHVYYKAEDKTKQQKEKENLLPNVKVGPEGIGGLPVLRKQGSTDKGNVKLQGQKRGFGQRVNLGMFSGTGKFID